MRPEMNRRLDVRRSLIYGNAPFVAPFASDLIRAWYPDQGITLATGVAGWKDKVGTADWAQATTANQPAYTKFVARPAIGFDGVNDYLTTPVITLSPIAAITVAMSFQVIATAGSRIVLECSADTAANNGGFYVIDFNGNIGVVFKTPGVTINRTINTVSAGVHRLIFTINSAAANGISQTFIDNVSTGASGAGNGPLGDYAWFMGARNGTIFPYPGKVGDLWVYGRSLTVGEVATVDAALAARCV